MSFDFFKKEELSIRLIQYYVLVVFLSFIGSYVLFRYVMGMNNYIQASADVLMHLLIIGLLYFMLKKHGLWAIPFVLVSFLIVAYSEIQSVYILNTYEYTGYPSAIFFEYPTSIALTWVYLSYGSYLLTNILVLNRESSKGFSNCGYKLDKPIYYSIGIIIFLAGVDGLFLTVFGLLNETAGIDLDLWFYYYTTEPKFFGAPTRTLYTYFYAGFVINLSFRLIELFMNKYRSNKTLSFKGGDYFITLFIFVYLFFLIIEATLRFGIDHWSIFASAPVLALILIFLTNKFFYQKNPEI